MKKKKPAAASGVSPAEKTEFEERLKSEVKKELRKDVVRVSRLLMHGDEQPAPAPAEKTEAESLKDAIDEGLDRMLAEEALEMLNGESDPDLADEAELWPPPPQEPPRELLTRPRVLREWIGLVVRSRRALETQAFSIPKGTLFLVEDVRPGLRVVVFAGDCCQTCGRGTIKARVRRCRPEDFDIVRREGPSRPARRRSFFGGR